ncbi:hypothetical protein QN277_023541 [Acacia crassicarpa]|uniref:Kazal-like domain-containing protein n=1 Tax=Acacia crassicarpa TaxID=499986 RepID=A0AAE1JLJ1_9FABA|nr:hypothetical protein QN277_023541 [Acacia crassicarpa]
MERRRRDRRCLGAQLVCHGSSHVLQLPSKAAGERQSIYGAKTTALWCPVKCFRTSLVCGVNGVTYWCGCAEAECVGTKVVKVGLCEVGSVGSTPLLLQALLLVHIVWHIVIGVSVFFGFF